MYSIVTLVSAIVIAVLLLGEFLDYRSVHVESSLIVDGGRKAKMAIDFDISFPKIPCYSTFSLIVAFYCRFLLFVVFKGQWKYVA